MVTRRSFIVRAFAGGMAAALPTGAVAAAIAPQSDPEPFNIAPGVDVIDGEPVKPLDRWGYDEWLPWLQENVATFPGAGRLELKHERFKYGPNAGGFNISHPDLPGAFMFHVNPDSGFVFMTLMTEGGSFDPKGMMQVAIGSLRALAA